MIRDLLAPMACNKWGQSKIEVIVVGGRVWGNFTLTPDITQQNHLER